MGNWVYVCKDEEEYAKTFEFCKVARTYQEIDEFIKSLGDRYNLKSRAYSNGELIYIVLKHERKDMKIYCIEKDGVKLRLTAQCDTGEVYSIDDLFGYFNSISSNKSIYDRETTNEDISIEYILSLVQNSRVYNLKEIRNHYNNAIRKINAAKAASEKFGDKPKSNIDIEVDDDVDWGGSTSTDDDLPWG